MHWQLGGNFGPVLKACEYRWMECSCALARYIWFEVVTDVADSLANELILWRILAIILIIMTIIHFMYWKKQWIKEINVTNETLKKVDFKVQDLELKISILTYKAQYDTWPLTQLVPVNNESDSENNPCAFPKLNAQNAYLKYFLARTRRKKVENKALMYNTEPQSLLSELNLCDVKTKCISSEFNDKLMRQTSYIEKKLSLTSLEQKRLKSEQSNNRGLKNNSSAFNLPEEPTAEENLKLYRSSSDSSLNDHLRSSYLGSKKITKINIKPGKLLHRKRISPEIAEKQLKFSVSSTNNSSTSKNIVFPKFLKQNYHSLYQDKNSKEDTHETLNQVKEKLQCLHSTLRNYSNEFESNTLKTSSKSYDNIKTASSSQKNNTYNYIKNQQGDYNYDESISLKKNINSHDSSKAVYPGMIKEDKTTKSTSQAYDELSYIHTEDVSNLLESNTNPKGYCVEIEETKRNLSNHVSTQAKETISDSDNNQQISLVESSKGSDSDDRSISALIQEALKFKQELMLQIQSRKEKEEINIQNVRNQSEPYDYSNWHSDSDFEPNSLDKITEESSGSSVVDKNSKTHILITTENCNNQNTSNKHGSLLNQHSSNEIDENAISNNKTISNEILLTDCEDKSQKEPETSVQNTEEIYQSNLDINLKIDSNVKPLSDTSSDTSVNRLLDRLIESERKCKSAKSLTNAKVKEDAADSMNAFIIPHTFFDNAPFESKQNSLPVEFDAERSFPEKIDSEIESYKNKNFDLSTLSTDEVQESETIQIISDARREKSKQNDEVSKDLFQKYESHSMTNKHFNKDNYRINSDNVPALSRNIYDSTNAVKSMSELQNDEMENRCINGKKAAGDFYSDSELIAQKNTQNSKKNVFPSGDSNSLESSTFTKGAIKVRSNLYHSFCKGQTGDNFQSGFKNSEQCSTKNSNSIQKQFAKINFELGNLKQIKAKSNLNLTTTEHVNDLPTHRRSKSHVTSSDNALTNQNKRAESEHFSMQLDQQISKKSFSKPCTPRPSRNCSNDVVVQFQTKKNISLSLSSKSSSKSSVPIVKDSNENNCDKNDMNRKPSNESVSSKSSTKSCLPVLKTRLESVINDNNDCHPKSSSAGSLKMNVQCFEPEEDNNSFNKNMEKQENQNLNELVDGKDTFTDLSGAFELEYCTDTHDYVSTYINTMIDNIELDTNTNNAKQIFDEHETELVNNATTNDEINPASLIPEQDVLLDSLIRHNDDLTNEIPQKTCSLELQSASSRVLSYQDSKESEVLVKPCTLVTSTSITDVSSLANVSNNKESVVEVKTEVPDQFTKEEYDTLVQLINEHPDFEHLLNLGLQK